MSLVAALVLAAATTATTTPAEAQAAGGRQAGRPVPTDPWAACPVPPLRRTEPREYTAGLAIDIGAVSEINQVADPFTSTGGSITLEPVVADNWTVADLDRREVSLRVNGSPVRFESKVEGDPKLDHRRLVADIPDGPINAVSYRVSWPVLSFNSEVDEAAAARIPWPRTWPTETQRFLAPSLAIDSDNPVFKAFVGQVAGQELRRVPVYLAAKDLVRRTIGEFRNIMGGQLVKEGLGAIRGFRLQNASVAARANEGSPGDLVGTCVAVLRAAGIPARPVVGIYSGDGDRSKNKLPSGSTTLCVWAEFHLPGAGWVPFDPNEMRGSGLPQANLQRPWRWFGTCNQLNRRVALAFDFAPIRQGFIQDWPAGWAWTISGQVQAPFRLVDATTPILVSRGRVRP